MSLFQRGEDALLEAAIREFIERESGVLEPDQPTAYSHERHKERQRAEFTPKERAFIRFTLGLDSQETP